MPEPQSPQVVQPTQPAPTAPPEPSNEPPAWAQELITTVSEQKQTIENLQQQLNTSPEPAKTNDPYDGWQPKEWGDIPKTAEQIAKDVVGNEFATREQAAEEARKAAEDARKQVDTQLDNQEKQLAQSGFLPEVKNSSDPNDPGRAVRKELYGLAYKLQTTDLVAVSETMKQLHESGVRYDADTQTYLKVNTPPAGAYAPVGSSNSATAGSTGKPTYDDIHKAKSLHELAARSGLQ